MRRHITAAAALSAATISAFALPASAFAQSQNFPSAGVTTLAGRCSKLVVGKLDVSKPCRNEIAAVALPNGDVTFIFTAQGKMLGFQGDGKAIKPASNGNARIPLTLVTTGVGQKMTGEVKVAGSCTFGTPYGGKPVAIECTAESKDSTFAANFQTNGKAPVQPKAPAAAAAPTPEAKPAKK
jgi:hypothetical protein